LFFLLFIHSLPRVHEQEQERHETNHNSPHWKVIRVRTEEETFIFVVFEWSHWNLVNVYI
jgi:hypothetical protein